MPAASGAARKTITCRLFRLTTIPLAAPSSIECASGWGHRMAPLQIKSLPPWFSITSAYSEQVATGVPHVTEAF